ncbi:MAG: glycosyl transferase [Actinomycetia bacterium]|nr:glycosyl transferase [Actinomycetes bacterium]
MSERTSVLLCTEGTYPFNGGGVSTWCDILCTSLDEVDFRIQAITGNPEVALKYELPANVLGVHKVPLWGTIEPAEHVRADESFAVAYRRRRHTTEALIEAGFVPLLVELVELLGAGPDPERGGRVLHELWRWFRDHDWVETWRSRSSWQAFCTVATTGRDDVEPTVWDLTTCFRWLKHFLTPLDAPIPETSLVHATLAGFPGLAGVVAKRERGTPFIVTDHGVFVRERYIAVSAADFTFFAKRFLLELSALVSRAVYHHADVVAPVADFNRRWEEPYGAHADRIETVHNGVDPTLFQPRPKPLERQGRPTVVAAARVFPLKDIENMIRGAAVARESVPDLHVLVYGANDVDLPYTNRCLDLVDELGLQGTFELAGFHPKPAEIYTEGDISVLSSISEGFPYTVIESMACGRPVVATDVGGTREALEGCGVVVPPRDPEALGAGMAQLLTDHELRQALGLRCREEVLRRFRTDLSVDAYRRIYERLTT